MIHRPPPSTLFPCTTLFRSASDPFPRLRLFLRGGNPDTFARARLESERAPQRIRQSLLRYRVSASLGTRAHRLRRRFSVDDKADRKSTRLNSSHVEISYAVF